MMSEEEERPRLVTGGTGANGLIKEKYLANIKELALFGSMPVLSAEHRYE